MKDSDFIHFQFLHHLTGNFSHCITPAASRDSLSVYHSPSCAPNIYRNVMLPCLSRTTREAVGSGRAWGRAEERGGHNLLCGITPLTAGRQAGDFMMTGRMAKGWGQGGGGGQPRMAVRLYRAEEAQS